MKAIFPNGINEITIEAVTQWDYGQTLEFEGDLPAVFEVHFAHKGLREAIVRSCSTASSVIIPDICIEQTSIIVAWIYEIGETSGKTIKTVYIPVTPRVRPEPTKDVPVEISDKYTESIAAINELIETINTTHSATSDYATEAGHAEQADIALHADGADYAVKAFYDNSDNIIDQTYAKINDLIMGDLVVDKAYEAEYAIRAGEADSAQVANKSVQAIADQNGKTIDDTYATKEELEQYYTKSEVYTKDEVSMTFARPTSQGGTTSGVTLYANGAILQVKSLLTDDSPIFIGQILQNGETIKSKDGTVSVKMGLRVNDIVESIVIQEYSDSTTDYVYGEWIVLAKFVDYTAINADTGIKVTYSYLIQRID